MRLPFVTASLLIAGPALIGIGFAGIDNLNNNTRLPQTSNVERIALNTKADSKTALIASEKQENSAQTKSAKNRKATVVKVLKGDSLSKIAKKHLTTYTRLYDANTSIKHPDVIYPGDEIRIPFSDEKLTKRELPADTAPVIRAEPKPKKAVQARKPVVRNSAPAVASGSVWDRLAQCESSGNWSINTGNGYYGGLQFLPSTWRSVGGTGLPHQHSREEQIKRAKILLDRAGWGQWPQCAAKLGLL